MGTNEITYIDPVTGLPTIIQAEDAGLFGVGDAATRPAAGDYAGDFWLLLGSDGRYILQRWSGAEWVDLTVGGPGGHEGLDTQTHALAEDSYTEITRTSGQVSDVSVYTDSGKTTLIRKSEITRSAGQISQVLARIYDGDGAEITAKRLTITYARSAGRIVSATTVEGT